MVSGYCRVLDGNRILVCERDVSGALDTGCRYPDCDYVPSCTLVQTAIEQARREWSLD